MFHVAPSTFAERFGYARWLRHLASGESPGFAEIGRAVERTGVAVSAWRDAVELPPDWRVHEPLSSFFGVDERWLIRDQGEAPRPDLWEVWIAARHGMDQMRPGAFMPDPRLDRKLTREEEERAVRASAAKAARQLRSSKGARRKKNGGRS